MNRLTTMKVKTNKVTKEHAWLQAIKDKMQAEQEEYDLRYFTVDEMSCGTFIECKSCGWGPHLPQSHILHGDGCCEFLKY